MKNLWNDTDAEAAVARYRGTDIPRDLALRVYTTRLLGGEPRLVLHGGGNTSVKTKARDLLTRAWSKADWDGRQDLLKAAQWLVQLETIATLTRR